MNEEKDEYWPRHGRGSRHNPAGPRAPAKLALLHNIKFVPVGKSLLSRFPNRDLLAGTKGGVLLSRVWQPGQKVPFCRVSANRDKRDCQCHGAGAPYQPGQKVHFFPVLISFSFQLYFHFKYTFISITLINVNIY